MSSVLPLTHVATKVACSLANWPAVVSTCSEGSLVASAALPIMNIGRVAKTFQMRKTAKLRKRVK
jgi:hypothetical protein